MRLKTSEIAKIPIRMPRDFGKIIKEESHIQNATNSQYIEHLIRNGIAIMQMHQDYAASGDKLGEMICGEVICTGIQGVHQKNEMEFLPETYRLSEKAKIRLDEIKQNFLRLKRKSTVLTITEILNDYLHECAYIYNQSLSLTIFMCLQAALSGWWLRSNPPDFDGFDPKKVDAVLEEIKNTYAVFDHDKDGKLLIFLKKTKFPEME